MTASLSDIMGRIKAALDGQPHDAFMRFMRKDGDVESRIEKIKSNHARISLLELGEELHQWVKGLPYLERSQVNYLVVVNNGDAYRNTNQPQFILHLHDFNLSRIAARSARIAPGVWMDVERRLKDIRDACPPAHSLKQYLVRFPATYDRVLVASTAREASHLFAALHVRDRKEARNWRKTISNITMVAEIQEKSTWSPGQVEGSLVQDNPNE